MTQSHNEVAPYFTVDQHTRTPEMILVNTDVWKSFSADEQKIIKEAVLEAAEFQRDEWVRQEKEYEKQAIEKGVTVTNLTPETFQQFVDAIQPIDPPDSFFERRGPMEAVTPLTTLSLPKHLQYAGANLMI
jgi:TRAP-type C4-dicarboxylate transport system substrate-binding protein